jgi:hypothetical protein
MLFNFFSRSVNTSKRPQCPKCKTNRLSRRMSSFAVTGRAKEGDEMDDLPIDESKMEQAMQMLAGEAEKMDQEDPKQAANLMRKLTDMTGLEMGAGMQEALKRMEQGEDPEQIEKEMGDILENEEPFELAARRKGGNLKTSAPLKDETLYDL